MITLLAMLKHDIIGWLALIPFLIVVKNANGKQDGIRLNYTRIIEAALIALLTAGISGVFLVQKMDVEIGHIEESLDELKIKVDKLVWERGDKE